MKTQERFTWPNRHPDEAAAREACEQRKKELAVKGIKASRKRTSFEALGYGGMYVLTFDQ